MPDNQINSASGQLFVIAAPSGAGKTSLVKALVDSMEDVEVSVSYTTRPKRQGEVDGVHYHFIDKPTFLAMVDNAEFLEHAEVFDNFYGTSEKKIAEQLKSGAHVILEIDWQGAEQVRKSFPESSGIFILPPSRSALEKRLQSRGQDSDEVISRRMRDAVNEISHYAEFDYLIVNDVFEQALSDLKAVINAKQLAFGPQSRKFSGLIADLLA